MPQPPRPPSILVSDADRERSVEVLRSAVVEGRLELEEFTDRIGLAQRSRTEDELARLTSDLPATSPPAPEESDKHLALCSQLVRKGRWELARRSSFRSIFGTVHLDLRQARLSSSEAEIDIYNLFGTVTVTVPEGIKVTVVGGGAFASQVIDPPSGLPIPNSPHLRIRARGPGGTLYVRSGAGRGGGPGRLLAGGEPA